MVGNGCVPGIDNCGGQLELLVIGCAFFGILILAALTVRYPEATRRLLGGIFVSPPQDNLARQVAELKEKVAFMESHVPDTHSDAMEDAITDRIQNGKLSAKELMALHRELTDGDAIDSVRMEQDIAVDQEFDAAAKTKRKLVNVFIGINFVLSVVLVSAAVRGTFFADIPVATQQILLGLYASMSLFIIYVYRSSNARLLVLLAVKEDNKRYFDALRFIDSRNAPLIETDIDVIKLLLTNRTEREKGQEHPYELVLKSISNSNILLKGGKVLAKPK
jgi:hypothetical protein